MANYELDQLGWLEFEHLVQALLKTHQGVGVEAWGGSGDAGNDAYFHGQLRYPTKSLSAGPFVFQCKFVAAANAAGARSLPALINAIDAESKRIDKRIRSDNPPKHYVLLTNAPVGSPGRTRITNKLKKVLPQCEIHVHDGQDICRWLDMSPTIVTRFPQLFTIADLMVLLNRAKGAGVFSRSEVAIQMARESAKVFVPTKPYYSARGKLRKFHFCILEGPPEMGKTTIGRVIAMTQVTKGWEALECKSPKEFHETFDIHRSQVFVADDFFGRTEYDPKRVSAWQDELPFIMRRLDRKHWLILTTRAHLLQIGKQHLDVAGENHRFPSLGEIVVNAADLNPLEKARIVYRHAKSADLSTSVRDAFRATIFDLIGNRHFTPERIRRLVADLSEMDSRLRSRGLKGEVLEKIVYTIRNPTHEMRTAFRKLDSPHKAAMFALLDADVAPLSQKRHRLETLFEAIAKDEDARLDSACLELSEGFVRLRKMADFSGQIHDDMDWIHPSCRDLAIDELSNVTSARQQFLQHCSLAGIKLALSIGGGAAGERALPLLRAKKDWALLHDRTVKMLSDDSEILDLVASAMENLENESAKYKTELSCLQELGDELLRVFPTTVDEWSEYDLKPFLHLRRALNSTADIPGLSEFWKVTCQGLTKRLLDERNMITGAAHALIRFSRFCWTLRNEAPDHAVTLMRTSDFRRFRRALTQRADDESHAIYGRSSHNGEQLKEEADDYMSLSQAYAGFAALGGGSKVKRSEFQAFAEQFEAEAEDLKEQAKAKGYKDDDDSKDDNSETNDESDSPPKPVIDIRRVFDDL